MLPLLIGTSPLMQRRSVDLPEPEGPMMHTTPPLATLIDTPFSTSTCPNDWCTSLRTTIGSAFDCGMAAYWSTA